MSYKTVLSYLTLTIFALISFYLSWIEWLLKFILSLCIYTIIFFIFHFLWGKIRKKTIMYLPDFINYFLKRVSVFLVFITVLFSTWAYLLNEVYPAPMPEYTITNWEKTVTFQAMSHIWTESFYSQIVQNITEHKQNWWVYFFEWVKPGSDENAEKFDNAIWMKFDDDLYANFSKLYGVVNQDNNDFLWLVNDKDFNVDLNMDQIVEQYEKKMKSYTWEVFENKLPVDANKVIIETLSELNEKQLKILVYVNKAILNFIIWSDSTQDFLTDNFSNTELFDVILWERNKLLATTINSSEYNDIYVTYWLLHYDWVLELLKTLDPNWRESSRRDYYPIKN